MATGLSCSTRTYAASRNAFWTGGDGEYAVKIDANGRLRYRRGAAAWTDFDPQPPGPATHVAADNNRVLVRTADGRLHWTCLATDIASWVDYTFGVMQGFATTSAAFHTLLDEAQAEFAASLDVAALLRQLYAVGDLWDGGQAPAPPTDRRALLGDWLGRYRAWLARAHTVPAGALHGPWNVVGRDLEAGVPAADWGAVADIAVGHWHQTVVTFYAALPDGRILYLDEEPMMPAWRVMPGTEDPAARAAAGLHADPDVVLVASHSVLGVLQPRTRTVAWRRFDYHNPGDFKLWPLLNWTEARWTTRPLPVPTAEAIALDASFHRPGGGVEPWPVPQPHQFLPAMLRRDEEALLQHVRDYQDTPPPFDWFALFGIGFRLLEIFGRLPPAPDAGPPPFDPLGVPEQLGRHVKHSKAIRRLVDGFGGLEAAIFDRLDDRQLFPAADALKRRAQGLRAAGTGFLITAWQVIREASARLDAMTGRLSVVGAFGDDPLEAVDAWPIDLWIRDRGGHHAHLCAAQARHAPAALDLRAGVTPQAPPSTGHLRWDWIGPATQGASGRLERRVRVDLADGLAASRQYTWTLQEAGRAAQIMTTAQPTAAFAIGLGADALLRVEGRDATGERVHASATLRPPRPTLELRLDLPGSTPHGPPTARHFASPDGRLLSAMTLTQQAYGTLRVRVLATELADGPCTLAWSATHHRAGTVSAPGLPHAVDVPTTAGSPPGTLRLADPAAPPRIDLLPVDLRLAPPVPFVLTVTARDALGQEATAHLALSPWFPVRQEVHGAPGAPVVDGLVHALDERVEALRDELRARTLPVADPLDGLTLSRAGDALAVGGLDALLAARTRSSAARPATPAADPTVEHVLASGWIERP